MNDYKNIILPISLFIISLFIFMYVTEIDEIVKGTGKIVVKSENKKIQHFEGGILDKLYVKQGQEVKVGEEIVKLKNIFFETSLRENEINQLILNIQIDRLNANINNLDFNPKNDSKNNISKIIKKEKEIYLENIAKLKNKILLIETQISQKRLKKREVSITLANLKLEKKLEKEKFDISSKLFNKKSISRNEYISSKIEYQKTNTKIEELKSNIPIIEKEIEELNKKKKITKQEENIIFLNKYNESQSKLYELQEKKKALVDRQSRMIIKSPINGIINNIKITTLGGVIKQGEEILEIIPTKDEKIIEAEIFDKDRAKIWIGQKVNVEVNAFPSTKYGYFKGEVISISPDSYIKKNNEKVFYTLKITFNENKKIKLEKILTGMTANINILTGKKSILEYIIKPLKYIQKNSFIEE